MTTSDPNSIYGDYSLFGSEEDHLAAEVLGGVNRHGGRGMGGDGGSATATPFIGPAASGNNDPKPWPANKLRVRAIDDHGQIRLEIDNPPTEEAYQILMNVLPGVLSKFLTKNQDYQNFGLAHLGAKAHFVGIWRKVGKLRRGLWDGEALAGEQVSEVMSDIIGHVLLALLEYKG